MINIEESNVNVSGGQVTLNTTIEEHAVYDERGVRSVLNYNDTDRTACIVQHQGIVFKTQAKDYEYSNPNDPNEIKLIKTRGILKSNAQKEDIEWWLPNVRGKVLVQEQMSGVLNNPNDNNLNWRTEVRDFVEINPSKDSVVNLLNGESGRLVIAYFKQGEAGDKNISWGSNIKFPVGFDSNINKGNAAITLFCFKYDGNFWHFIAGGKTQELKLTNYVAKNFADDGAAQFGGIELGQVYHSGGILKIRTV